MTLTLTTCVVTHRVTVPRHRAVNVVTGYIERNRG